MDKELISFISDLLESRESKESSVELVGNGRLSELISHGTSTDHDIHLSETGSNLGWNHIKWHLTSLSLLFQCWFCQEQHRSHPVRRQEQTGSCEWLTAEPIQRWSSLNQLPSKPQILLQLKNHLLLKCGDSQFAGSDPPSPTCSPQSAHHKLGGLQRNITLVRHNAQVQPKGANFLHARLCRRVRVPRIGQSWISYCNIKQTSPTWFLTHSTSPKQPPVKSLGSIHPSPDLAASCQDDP